MVNLTWLKRKMILLASLLFSWWASPAQPDAATFRKDTLKKTEIELLYSHYIQEGNNSAVTGGIGTEKLTVYATQAKLRRRFKKGNSLQIQLGTDIISSASTDNIDAIVSSASILDARSYLNTDYSWSPKNDQWQMTAGTGISIESDYLSFPFRASTSYTNKDQSRTYSLGLQFFYDDLRWGRIDKDHFRPVTLIYPAELRGQNWFDTYLRRSFNAKAGFTQIVNKRLVIGVFPEWTYQSGILATPFHRVYFNDGSLRVEKLPERRMKWGLGLKANAFVGGGTILKNGLSLYRDDFGIVGIAIEQESNLKLNYLWSIQPFFRFYHQRGAKYFAPFEQHSPTATYYTSDYDLSSFNSYKLGVGFRYAPGHYLSKRLAFNELNIRYSFFYRSNDLHAHIISVQLAGIFYEKGKK